ncbi:SMI1/KNR4 family protein [Lihuaxuella thermophila]|uniref:SMI1-KNR4 cell-wall n=1 Tax=Lihuaxuella thermophila TaxID=1173111 RepID=A0A1H8H722_9BACL|nr:SMI1/KNR4 family protein [Lihuaxuella thermophila]SEN51800.1 SMI1-KNR4 cell-wall [Lihuaxuella thermophila]
MKDIINLIYGGKPGVDEETLNTTENSLGASFPSQYKELVKLINNCEIGEWIFYPIKDPKNIRKTWDDIVRNNQPSVRFTHIPEDLIQFAENGTGNKLCFKINNNKMEEAIYFWDCETGLTEKIADNLKQFIQQEYELDNEVDLDDE